MVKLLDGGFRHVHMNSKGFEKSQSKENCLRQYSPTFSDLSSCFTPNIVPINSWKITWNTGILVCKKDFIE